MREYRYRPRNLRLRRRVISLVLAAIVGISGYVVIKNNKKQQNLTAQLPMEIVATDNNVVNNEESIIIPVVVEIPLVSTAYASEPEQLEEPVIAAPTYTGGDSIIATSTVNMRFDSNKSSFKIGELPVGSVVDRIKTDGNWDLIRYNGQIAYVCSDYTRTNEIDYNNEYYYVEDYSDIVRTTSKLYFRLGPSKSEQDICLLNDDEELVVVGKAIPFNNPEDVWYLVKARGQMGFVSAQYTRSLRDTIRGFDPGITDVRIENIGYLKNYSTVFDAYGNPIKSFDAYQAVKVLEDMGNCYLVEINKTVGLVDKNNVKTYNGTFVVVDLSDQSVYLYCNTDMVFESKCTTGADRTPTDVGAFSVSERTNSRYFSETAQSRYMWARFDGGNGFHDAPWEAEKNFGSQKFRKNNGSKGCVRLPDAAAAFLKDYIKVGTKVLVKE